MENGDKMQKIHSKTRKNFFKHFWQKSSIGTKLSFLIMGSGNFYHKRFGKGLIFLSLQVLFILLMVFSPKVNDTPIGAKALENLITLGTFAGDSESGLLADNSMLMLLFGVLTLGIIFGFIYLYISNIKSGYKSDLLKLKNKYIPKFKDDLHALIDERFHVTLLTPAIIGIVTFTVLPTIFMILIAFTNFDSSISVPQNLFTWAGFQNFGSLFKSKTELSSRFLPVVSWTLIWAFFATFTCYIGGILLAILINGKTIKLKRLWRTIFMMTIAIPQFISLLAVKQLLSASGPINEVLKSLGIISSNLELFGSSSSNVHVARTMVILINIWVGIPYTMLMTSGILLNIPSDLYEAGIVDGANRKQMFFKITLPYVLFVTTPYLITSFIGNITSFNIIFLLTGGGPSVPGYQAGGTDLLVTWLYKLTIDNGDYNIGAVVSILTFILTATGTLITYRRSKAFKEEEAFQ